MWNLVHFFLCFYGFDPLKCRKHEQKQSQNCTKGSFREVSSPNPHTFLLFTLFSPWKVLIFLVPSFFLMHFLAQKCADNYIYVVLHCVNVWFFSAITQIKSFRKSQFQNNALMNNYAYIFLYYLAFFFS